MFPKEIYADDDLVCSDNQDERCRVKYIRADIHGLLSSNREDIINDNIRLQNLLCAEFKALGIDPNELDGWGAGFERLRQNINSHQSRITELEGLFKHFLLVWKGARHPRVMTYATHIGLHNKTRKKK